MLPSRNIEQPTSGQPQSFPTRRGSLGPGTLADFFTNGRVPTTTSAYPGPISTAAAAQANRRRMSMSSATGTSPPGFPTGMSMRRGSISSVSSASSAVDESAIEEGDGSMGSPTSLGSSPFARRLSFGARAMRDVRVQQGRSFPVSAGAASPTVTRGFWLDNNAKNGAPAQGPERDENPTPAHRRQSISVMPEPANSVSSKSFPHDPFQERVLRGDFYMD